MRWLIAKGKALVARIGRLPVVLRVSLIALVMGVVFGGTYLGYRVYSYTQTDPQFCRSCHLMEKAWDVWAGSKHNSLNCHQCHEINALEGAELVLKAISQNPQRLAKHARVSDEACAKCHESGDPQWIQVANSAGHKVHVEEQNIACQKCHGISIHKFVAPTTICGVCHEDHTAGGAKAIKNIKMSPLHCYDCHNYLAENNPLKPSRETCLACHKQIKSSVTWPENAPMKWDCRECHKPHEQAMPVVQCDSCHKFDTGNVGKHKLPTHSETKCQVCHKPHEWRISNTDGCLTCHPAGKNLQDW